MDSKNSDLFGTCKMGVAMHLYETEEGDKWVCIICGVEKESMIKAKKWEWIFDKGDQTLRCSLCNQPDYDFED